MEDNRNLQIYSARQIQALFNKTVTCILDGLGVNAFKPTRSLNAALLDSLMVAIARRLEVDPLIADIVQQYESLRGNEEYTDLISRTTAAPERVKRRIQLANEAFGSRA